VISSVQNANDHYPWWQRLVARRIATWADVIISCSASVREISIRVEGLPPNRVVVIPNGLDWTAYTKPLACEALAALFGIPLGAVMLGNVGRLTYQKGQDVLLQALAATGRPNLHLIIAGMGECETALREQAQRLGITGRVHFVGHRRDLPQLLGALDLYVHASRFEGMPIAVLEAMAAGCPIVATAVNGICEIIEDGLQGWLVPTEDPAALATTIRRALDDPAEGRRRGDRARERVREQFSEEAMVRAWEHVLTRDPD
jgi:glycosyltransferase involved in cell wall biosynthesis